MNDEKEAVVMAAIAYMITGDGSYAALHRACEEYVKSTEERPTCAWWPACEETGVCLPECE